MISQAVSGNVKQVVRKILAVLTGSGNFNKRESLQETGLD